MPPVRRRAGEDEIAIAIDVEVGDGIARLETGSQGA